MSTVPTAGAPAGTGLSLGEAIARRFRSPASSVHDAATQRRMALVLARERLAAARSEAAAVPIHRALRQSRLRASVVLQALLVAVVLTGLLLWLQAPVQSWWQQVILFWSNLLGIPLAAGPLAGGLLLWNPGGAATLTPSPAVASIATAIIVVLYALTYWMRDAMTPLKYLVRALCVLQASALAFFLIVPSWFSQGIAQHVQSILSAGYILMLAIPCLISGGYALLRIPGWSRLAHPLLLVAYFAVMVPHQAVLHAWLLQHLSIAVMPLLYLCFGVVFDMLIFVALYAWLASRIPRSALQ